MIDVKKLITGFLILATAATCSGIIFSFINFGPAAAANSPSLAAIAGVAGSNTANENAFMPTEDQVQEAAADLEPELASSSMMVTSTDPSNLTDDVATEFVNGIVSANPTGPTGTDSDGNPTFNSPDVTQIGLDVEDAAGNFSLPDWNAEAAAIPVMTISTSSAAALTNYGTDVYNSLNNHLANNTQVQAIVTADPTSGISPDELAYVGSQFQGTLQDISSLKVPTAAVAYQKSLVTYLVYEKNMAALNTLAATDPVRASLIFQDEQENFAVAQQSLLTQAQALESSLSLLQPEKPQEQRGNILLSFVNETFGIPKAQALLPVFDPVTWGLISANQAQKVGQQLLAILKNTLLQILKNTLVAIIQRKVLAWVQGSGAPRFITNWGTTLINAAQQNAINIINNDITNGCVYSAFAPQLNITLKALYNSSNAACANAFAAALGANSFQQFYNSFSNGGFVTFSAAMLPDGNPYGADFFEAQKSDLAYHNQQSASNLQAQNGQGFTGDQYCTDGSNPSASSTVCQSSLNGVQYNMPSTGCAYGDTQVHISNNGLCANGSQPITQTPSAVTAFTLNTAGGATTQQITAANDIAGLINSVLSSLVLGLANAAVNAAGQVVNQTLSGINPTSITAGTNISGVTTSSVSAISNSNSPVSSIPLACSPLTQTLAPAAAGAAPTTATSTTATSTSITGPMSLAATGGTLDANDNPPIYSWSDSNGGSGSGATFSDTFSAPGTYTVTLSDSTGDAPATCTVIQQ